LEETFQTLELFFDKNGDSGFAPSKLWKNRPLKERVVFEQTPLHFGIGSAQNNRRPQAELEQKLQVEGKRFGPLLEAFEVGDEQREAVGTGGLEFIEVKLVFLAPTDAVEKEPYGFVQ
jgi:hypothetical protein